MGRLFGTDGVRGIANQELTSSLAFNLGRASSMVLQDQNKKPLFIIGRDTRISGDMLESALVAGILSSGSDVIKLGVLPTPGVAYLVQHYQATAGVVISASHNPYEYNGIKFFNSEGYKLNDSIEEKIEDIVLSDEYCFEKPSYDKLGRCLDINDGFKIYTDYLISTLDCRLDGLSIVLDSANGAAYKTAARVYTELGASIHLINNEPSGVNINKDCGSTHPEQLCEEVVKNSADLGLAFDGDADRLIVVDEKGNILDGDIVLCTLAEMLKSENRLKNNILTTTVMSNIGLHKFAESKGILVETTSVGDRYVIESMLKTGSSLGGEQSGHMIFREYSTTGDGVLSSLQFVRALIKSGLSASELGANVKIYPQYLANVRVKSDSKNRILEDEEIQNVIKNVERELNGQGRVLVRASGTEPLIRVMVEGDDDTLIKNLANDIAKAIEIKFAE